MNPIETEGKTVADAVDAALKQAGLRRDQVEVDVLQEGAAGVLGFGAKPARVRITEKRWGPGSAPPIPAKPTPAPRPERRDPSRSARPHNPERRNQPARAPEPRRVEPRREPAPAPAPVRVVREEAPRPRREEAPRPRREEAKPLTPAEATDACARAQGEQPCGDAI